MSSPRVYLRKQKIEEVDSTIDFWFLHTPPHKLACLYTYTHAHTSIHIHIPLTHAYTLRHNPKAWLAILSFSLYSHSPSPLSRRSAPIRVHQSLQDSTHILSHWSQVKVVQLGEWGPRAGNRVRDGHWSSFWETCVKTKLHIGYICAGCLGSVRVHSLMGA